MLLFTRIIYCLSSVVISAFGVISYVPNLMLSDCGTKSAVIHAYVGVMASYMFIFTGICGFCFSIVRPQYLIFVDCLFWISCGTQILAFCPFY